MPRSTPVAGATRLLPEYEKPPVVEVACSIQFEPINELHAGRLGLLWGEYEDRYPRVEQQPPLSPIREKFESKTRIGFSFEGAFPMFPMPRLWFLNTDGTRLIQVQRDHFIVNWRKLDTQAEYPRYQSIRDTLVEEFGRFRDFLKDEELALTPIVQTELTYVNHIDARQTDASRKPLSQIVRIWTGETPDGKLPQFEEASFNARYLMRDGDQPTGRLHINLEPQLYVRDNAPVYALTLIARGAPASSELEGALAFLDKGHEAIVEGFTAITTDEMHAVWGRQQ
ncbi:MAG: TIGR04255 family protein [Gemmatimonadaceae bacterium]